MMLMFYSYYKQAMLGPCNIPRPTGYWDTAGKAKWDAWNSLGNMSKEEAMQAYLNDIQLILETLPVTEEVSDLLEALGGYFFEEVEGGVEEEEEEAKRTYNRPFAAAAERKAPGPDMSLLRVKDRRWRSEVSSSNGTVEPSVSSMTNGTHSSLDSEVEEEELAYSEEPLPENRYRHLNRHLSERLRANDSDNEEFCDSMEHLAMDEKSGVPRAHSSETRASQVKRRSLQGETLDEDLSLQEDAPHREGLHTERRDSCWSMSGIGSRSSGRGSGSQLFTNGNAAEGWVMQNRTEAVASGNLNEHIAMALTRLQEDMANVLQRLNTLEALTTLQTRSLSQARQDDSLSLARKSPSWWPFHLSPTTVAFTTVWPLISHWLVQIYLLRKRKKIN
ncbi:acyl-CoA-binding domain-containing protein 5 isoform X2 [Coregonus clupeaformis]|nr:acyl-CoA-binding domain-containing protein 5 isoform X2 [Coregonus clupeaformis]